MTAKGASGVLHIFALPSNGQGDAVALSATPASTLETVLKTEAKVELDWVSLYHNTNSDGVDEYFERCDAGGRGLDWALRYEA